MLSEAQEIIIDRFKHPQFAGVVEAASQQADGVNQVCGDEVHLELRQENGRIVEIRHTVRACAICSAAADMLAEELAGEPVSRIYQITPEEIQGLLGIPLSPIRLKCALLPVETLRQALKTD